MTAQWQVVDQAQRQQSASRHSLHWYEVPNPNRKGMHQGGAHPLVLATALPKQCCRCIPLICTLVRGRSVLNQQRHPPPAPQSEHLRLCLAMIHWRKTPAGHRHVRPPELGSHAAAKGDKRPTVKGGMSNADIPPSLPPGKHRCKAFTAPLHPSTHGQLWVVLKELWEIRPERGLTAHGRLRLACI